MFMQNNLLVRLSLLSVMAGLSACSTLPEHASSIDASSNATMTRAAVGSRVVLPAGNELGATSVRIVDEYRAASGRLCRRVEISAPGDVSRVMCQREQGQWTFTRGLFSSSSRQGLPPLVLAAMPSGSVDQQDPIIVDSASLEIADATQVQNADAVVALTASGEESADAVQLRLNAGETLWRFSVRTTGDAMNWTRIAQFNGISDASSVRGGEMLNVPAELYLSSR